MQRIREMNEWYLLRWWEFAVPLVGNPNPYYQQAVAVPVTAGIGALVIPIAVLTGKKERGYVPPMAPRVHNANFR